MIRILYILIISILLTGCTKEVALPVIVDFETDVFNEDYSIPVQIVIINNTEGGDDYEWRFEGGIPSSSVNRNPGVILYEIKGVYNIELTATNRDGSRDTKTIEIQIDDPVIIDFNITNLIDNFSPATYTFQNNASGANSFLWTFEGGTPTTSTNETPGEIVFTEPGEHNITLEISNGRETYNLQKTIIVEPFLISDFDYEIAFQDDDLQIPVLTKFKNTSISATSYQWTFEGANITSSTEENPEVSFIEVGTHKITLTATNGKETKTTIQSIEVFNNTNLRTIENIKLGINTANNEGIGSFYNITDRLVYLTSEITTDNDNLIDLVFFGFNQNFTENFFTSPDNLSETSFENLQNAKTTLFINSQELDNRTDFTPLTSAQFDAMENDDLLHSKIIEETPSGIQGFDNSVIPRIVLFQTQEGQKGAIKIKEFVTDGQNSYVLLDIKLQKEAR